MEKEPGVKARIEIVTPLKGPDLIQLTAHVLEDQSVRGEELQATPPPRPVIFHEGNARRNTKCTPGKLFSPMSVGNYAFEVVAYPATEEGYFLAHFIESAARYCIVICSPVPFFFFTVG